MKKQRFGLCETTKQIILFPEREFIKEKICVTQPKDTQRRPNMEREKHDDV